LALANDGLQEKKREQRCRHAFSMRPARPKTKRGRG
jgi:hypothetical protein